VTEVSSDWPCQPGQVARARRWLREVLTADESRAARGIDELRQSGELILSELLTNAIQAGCSTVTVRVATDTRAIRIGVTDDAGGIPLARPAAPTDLSGRGLAIVTAVADDWGVLRSGSRKEVWATLSYA
jgi:anti-sigma regulatory factor (Ser/Thr protein kinase)